MILLLWQPGMKNTWVLLLTEVRTLSGLLQTLKEKQSPASTYFLFSPGIPNILIPVPGNFIVEDLSGLLNVLKEEGVTIAGEPIDEEYGKFGWILDPEGNKIELWEPPKG
jgi:predicted enzyme related to lactoylglutathione lyase